MKILLLDTDGMLKQMTIEGGDDGLREYLKGDTERICLDANLRITMAVNKEGKLLGLQENKRAELIYQAYHNDGDIIEGPAVFCSYGSGETLGSITQVQAKELKTKLFIQEYVEDPQRIMSRPIEGVYLINYINKQEGLTYPAYIGERGKIAGAPSYMPQNIAEELYQHFHAWVGNGYTEYWLGLADEDLKDGWKIEVQLIQKETNWKMRKLLAAYFIHRDRPILQDTAGGRFNYYPNSNYPTIYPWHKQRREAFKVRCHQANNSREN